MGTFAQDFVHGFRTLRHRPGLTAAAVLSLALGLGAGTAIYSLVDTTLLHPLPVEEPARLAAITSANLSYPTYRDFRDQSRAFSGLACAGWRGLTLAKAAGEPALVRAEVVSGNYFDVLGVRAVRGRSFLPADDTPGAPPVAVIGEVLARQLGSGASVGRTLVLNGQPFTVVGVAPSAFRGIRLSQPADLWIPIHAWPRAATGRLATLGLDQRGWSWLGVFGRLAPGISLARAEANLGVLARQQLRVYPGEMGEGFTAKLGPLTAAAAGPGSRGGLLGFFGLLAALVGIALGVACANVANLLLVQAVERRREMGIRVALGAGRWRLVRQLFAESTLLSLLGGAAALPVAIGALHLLARFELPGGISPGRFGVSGVALAPGAFGFAFLLALATGLLFGLAPALQASRPDPAAVLQDRSGGGARTGSRLRDLLAAAQIALCLPLLIGAGLFLRSLEKSLAADPGFTVDRVALAGLDLGLARYTAPQAAAFRHDLAQRLAASPGVLSASWAALVPIDPDSEEESLEVEGYRPGPGEERSVDMNFVAPGYFRTMGIPLLAGRDFADADAEGRTAARVAVVSRAMARRYWPGQDPIGRTLRVLGERTTVVGVAEDARYHSLADTPGPYLYLAIAQNPVEAGLGSLSLLVPAGAPAAVLPAVRRAVHDLDRKLPITRAETLAEHLGALLLPQRFAATLLNALGFLTLVLAAVGIYGIVAYAVGRRTREIGVRMALGAGMGEILRLVVGGGALRIGLGLAAGLGAAAAVTRLAARFLYGVSATDPLSFGGAALLLAAVALAATWLPARRAARIDPSVALRSE
jgi:predicted permease